MAPALVPLHPCTLGVPSSSRPPLRLSPPAPLLCPPPPPSYLQSPVAAVSAATSAPDVAAAFARRSVPGPADAWPRRGCGELR
eukprot:4482794-Pleurochrysis_carterae.AAC.1